MCAICMFSTEALAAETNTVSSTVVTDKSVPTANAPSIVINNSDVCKSAYSAGVQTQILGIASGITVTAVAALCQDARIFDAMIMAGTPCPYRGKIGKEAQIGWEENPQDIPSGSRLMDDLKKKKNLKTNSPQTRKNNDYQTGETDPWLTDHENSD